MRLASKGVEIIPGNRKKEQPEKNDEAKPGKRTKDHSNETGIKNALSQVRFGAASRMFGFPPLYPKDFDEYLYRNFHFILPIIVTTAELLVMGTNTGVEEIRQADVTDQVASKVGAVICKQYSDQRLRRHIKLLLAENFETLLKSSVTATLAEAASKKMFGPVAPNRTTFAVMQAMAGPDSVIIVNLEHLNSFLDSLQKLFTEQGALQEYKFGAKLAENRIIFDIEKHRSRNAEQVASLKASLNELGGSADNQGG